MSVKIIKLQFFSCFVKYLNFFFAKIWTVGVLSVRSQGVGGALKRSCVAVIANSTEVPSTNFR